MENNLPEGWNSTDIKTLCSITTGKRDVNEGNPEGKFPFFTCAQEVFKINSFEFEGESILIAGNGFFNVKYFDGKFNAYQRTYVLQNFQIAAKYLYYYISAKLADITKDNRGSTIRYIRLGDLADYEIPLPPLLEQHRIVAKLDSLFEKTESNKQRLEKIPSLLKRFRQSVLAAAVSGKLTEEWRIENKLDEWKEKRIDSLFKVRTGLTPLRSNENYYKNGTIPWAKTGEVKNNDIFEIEEKITQYAIDETGIKIFPVNSILVAMYGEGKTRGSIGRLKIPAATNQACAVLINEQMDFTTNQFVFLFLLSKYDEMRMVAVGGVRPNLNLDKVKSIVVSLPSLEEQKEIVKRVEQLFAFADKIESRYTKAKAMLDKLPQSILAKAFRGELVPQNPTDEPASKLLERIKAEKARTEKTPKKRKSK